MPVSAQEFFSALYDGVGAGFIEIRPILDDDDPRRNTEDGKRLQAKARRFFRWPKEGPHAAAYVESIKDKDFHMYFGVALRKDSHGGGKKNVGCCTAVYADVDFKDVEPDVVRKLLAEFPCKPSIVVKSGNGLHVYWLMKEPLMESSFPRLETLNRAMLKHLRAQIGTQDCSRVLRVPGTANIKKKYADPKPVTTVSYWHPEWRYTLDDLEQYLPPEDLRPVKTYVLEKSDTPQNGTPRQGAPDAPSFELEDAIIDECAGILSKVWLDGHRHNIALHVAGWCAHAGYSPASAEKLMQHICAAAGDVETEDRITAVRHSYQKFMAGERVAGFTALEKMAKDSFPELFHERMTKVIAMVRKSVPRTRRPQGQSSPSAPAEAPASGSAPGADSAAPPHEGGGGGRGRGKKWGGGRRDDPDPNFTLVKYTKFKSTPPRYTVTIEKDGHEHVVECEGKDLLQYTNFQQVFFQQTDRTINQISGDRWGQMLDACKKDFSEAPMEATLLGALDAAMEEFLANAKEKSDLGLLKSAPSYDEEDYFFKFQAWQQFVADAKIKGAEGAALYHHIRRNGWIRKAKRFGRSVAKVWAKHFDAKPGLSDTDLPVTEGPSGPVAPMAQTPEPAVKNGPTEVGVGDLFSTEYGDPEKGD